MNLDINSHVIRKLITLGGFFIKKTHNNQDDSLFKEYFPGRWLDFFPEKEQRRMKAKFKQLGHGFVDFDNSPFIWGYTEDAKGSSYFIGPITETRISPDEKKQFLMNYQLGKRIDVSFPIIPAYRFATFIACFESLINGNLLNEQDVLFDEADFSIDFSDFVSDDTLTLINTSENNHYNTSYWEGATVLNCIKSGDLENLSKKFDVTLIDRSGIVGTTPQKREEYLVVIAIHDMGVAAIDGGLYPSEANRIADHFLRKVSTSNTLKERLNLAKEAAFTCTEAVAKKNNKLGNMYIVATKEYILTHITQKITLGQIAETLKISESYLSRIFHANTGVQLFQYIVNEKLEASIILLVQTDKKVSEISNLFSFSNQSYYSKQFRKKYQMSPMEYRQRHRTLNYNPRNEYI